MVYRRAFTITELLVIVGIVTILSAILFPVFAQVTRPVGQDVGSNRAYRTALAVLSYLPDHDYVFPYGVGPSWWAPTDGGWVLNILPYLGTIRRMQVPADPQSKATWPTWVVGMPGAENISFAANGLISNEWSPSSGWEMVGIMGMAQETWMTKVVTAYDEVTHPSDTVMLAQAYGGYPLYSSSDFFSGVDWWDASGVGGLIPDFSRDGSPYLVNGVVFNQNNRNGGVNAISNGRCRIVWVDGHVSRVTPHSTNPVAKDPTQNKWWATRL